VCEDTIRSVHMCEWKYCVCTKWLTATDLVNSYFSSSTCNQFFISLRFCLSHFSFCIFLSTLLWLFLSSCRHVSFFLSFVIWLCIFFLAVSFHFPFIACLLLRFFPLLLYVLLSSFVFFILPSGNTTSYCAKSLHSHTE